MQHRENSQAVTKSVSSHVATGNGATAFDRFSAANPRQEPSRQPADGAAPAEPLSVATDDRGVMTLTLNRPQRHNAFDNCLIQDLTACLAEVAYRTDVRVVILTGSGKSFCSGADLEWMRSMSKYTREENIEDARRLAGMMAALSSLPKPTIARVNGTAFGGGVGLICCCDMAVSSNRAKFALTEVRLGLVPAVVSPYVISAIGVRQCQRYFQTGETVEADTAVRLGLIHEAVEHDCLDNAVERQVRLLLLGGPNAQAANKHLIDRAKQQRCSNENLIDFTATLIANLRVSPEGQEGISAFLEKRTPIFHST